MAGGAGLASTSAAAQSDTQSPPQGLLANGLNVEGGDRQAFFTGFMSSLMPATSPVPDAKTLADRMRNEFMTNSEHWVTYGNWLISEYDDVEPLGTVTLGVDVVVPRYWPNEDESVETMVKAEYDTELGEYTDLGWWIETPDEPDYQVEIRDKAARNAADELQEYRREYIDEEGDNHSLPDESYVSELSGTYATHLRFGEDSKHILQLLVGDTGGI
ncbi:hypothetical protein C489_05683 [Natrinema versiforme JCM 10478]|uniref:Uncharacterized protein n=1 Tax=Natrinema versiforme JCM 10478 TaxID=1227496 RepID=L9Y532_9EURY|nr:hypothetical protein C489_05683 [Natrinema versiforme JCM 10478]